MPQQDQTLLVTPRFQVHNVTRENARGQVISKAIIRHPGAVTILPLIEPDNICLIRNFRVTVQRPLLELPAGTREVDEDPLQTAIRELREETGYEATNWELLHTFYLSPGILDEQMHLYLATGLTDVGADRQIDEDIENVIISWSSALEMIRSREIEDAKTLLGLLLYQQVRESP